jgi:hypothetical protein
MEKSETLKKSRDLLLKLHKVMLDNERELYEQFNGPLSPTEFLTLLLENEDFAWLRKFSMLIVEIDEMFAQKDGYEKGMLEANLGKVKELVHMAEPDEYFRAKYQLSIQSDPEAARLHAEIREVVENL